MKYRIKRIWNHVTRKYAVRIGNPAAVRDEPHRAADCIVNAAEYIGESHPFTNPRMAEYVAAEINRHYPDAAAHVEEVRRYYYNAPSLNALWRNGNAAII